MSDGTPFDPGTLAAARRLRTLSYALEATLYAAIAGSALAIGAVHPWAYVPLWQGAALVGILVSDSEEKPGEPCGGSSAVVRMPGGRVEAAVVGRRPLWAPPLNDAADETSYRLPPWPLGTAPALPPLEAAGVDQESAQVRQKEFI